MLNEKGQTKKKKKDYIIYTSLPDIMKRAKLKGQKSDQWLPGAGGRDCLQRSTVKFSVVMEMFCILIETDKI